MHQRVLWAVAQCRPAYVVRTAPPLWRLRPGTGQWLSPTRADLTWRAPMCPVPRPQPLTLPPAAVWPGSSPAAPAPPKRRAGWPPGPRWPASASTVHAGATASPNLALACLACASSRRAVPSARATSSTARRRRRNSASSVPRAMSGGLQHGASRGGTVRQIAAFVFRRSQYLLQTRCSRDGLADRRVAAAATGARANQVRHAIPQRQNGPDAAGQGVLDLRCYSQGPRDSERRTSTAG